MKRPFTPVARVYDTRVMRSFQVVGEDGVRRFVPDLPCPSGHYDGRHFWGQCADCGFAWHHYRCGVCDAVTIRPDHECRR